MNTDLSKLTKGHRGLGVVVSILMILLGIWVFQAPVSFLTMSVWIFVVGLMIYGAYLIVDFAISDVKSGWKLATGIMSLILGFLLIFAPNLAKAESFAFILGFMTLFSGINHVTAASAMKKQGGDGTGWLMASGIISIILGFFFILNPFFMLFTFTFIAGIYLIVGAIALFASSMSSN